MMTKSGFQLGLFFLALTACSEVVEERVSEDYQPIYDMPEELDPSIMLRVGFLRPTGVPRVSATS
jgi:hypothetical protein